LKSYTHLTEYQRYQIYLLLGEQKRKSYIARALGVHPSTISREITRNSGLRGYRPKQAQEKAMERCVGNTHARKFDASTWEKVREGLEKQWSPEQISERMKKENEASISHESIYRHLLTDRKNDGVLYRHLRWQKKRKRRFGSKDRRGQIRGRVGIEQRPPIVEERSRVGDWEGDLIVGGGHKGAIVTLVERSTGLLAAIPVESKESIVVEEAIIKVLTGYKESVHTITFDNGKEFAGHERIAKALDCEVYFARPYHSWERGTNENTNGLLRQYFPKKMNLKGVKAEDVEFAVERLNNRPRKRHAYQTPLEAFDRRRREAT
jgi:IS30 family transposase